MPRNTPFDSKDFATITADMLTSLASGSGGRAVLTDNNEGSVVRTLAEAFARELAVCYQQLIKIYQFGFLDTAEGDALDNVVALLGVSRQLAGHIEGNVGFFRSQPATEDIPVPSGTLLAGRDCPVFETTQDTFLLKGQLEVTTRVRSLEPGSQTVRAKTVNTMPRPIWGIETVSNPADLLPVQLEETDDELRARTRRILQKANLGTPLAIEEAVRSLGITQVLVMENKQTPGIVDVFLGDPDISEILFEQAKNAVQEVRPAGIRVNVSLSNRIIIEIDAMIILREDFSQNIKDNIRDQIKQALQQYFDSLKSGELVRITKITSILTSAQEVAELKAAADVLRPFIVKDGKPTDVSASYRLSNGDIRVDPHERAFLDLNIKPLLLSLNPPTLDVWVDVILTVDPMQPPALEQSIRESLQKRLDTIKTGETISFNSLIEPLGKKAYKAFCFYLIHTRDNLAVRLSNEMDSDVLKENEILRVSHINFVQDAKHG